MVCLYRVVWGVCALLLIPLVWYQLWDLVPKSSKGTNFNSTNAVETIKISVSPEPRRLLPIPPITNIVVAVITNGHRQHLNIPAIQKTWGADFAYIHYFSAS